MTKVATKRDIKELRKEIRELSKSFVEMHKKMAAEIHNLKQWIAYINLKEAFFRNPKLITPKFAQEILEEAKGHVTTVLFRSYFKKIGVKGFET